MAKKPKKPYADYPLYAHAGGVWAKKIRGKVHYFGPWTDPQGALESYLAKCDYLYGGLEPPSDTETVGELIESFLEQKRVHLATDDITPTTFKEYEATCGIILSHFGKRRPVASLTLKDFGNLRIALSSEKCKCKVTARVKSLKKRLPLAEIRVIREALKHGRTRFKSGVSTVTVTDPTAHAELLKLPNWASPLNLSQSS